MCPLNIKQKEFLIPDLRFADFARGSPGRNSFIFGKKRQEMLVDFVTFQLTTS